MADENVIADYDSLADVLYLSVGLPDRRAMSVEDESGLIWRRSPSGEFLGVTVRDFKFYWSNHESEFVRLLTANLHLPKGSVQRTMREYA